MDLKWIEPESRLILKLLGRNLETFSDEARRTVNWAVLGGDILAVIILLAIL